MSAQRKENSTRDNETHFSPQIAGAAMADALHYFKKKLHWSEDKIARILHLSSTTINRWLKDGSIPISNAALKPDVQVIVHLLAIHHSLEAMFEDSENQIAWLTTHHPVLNDCPEKIMGESMDGLIFIRKYLEYVRSKGA